MYHLLKFLHFIRQIFGVAPLNPGADKLQKYLHHSWCLLTICHIYVMSYLQAWQRIDQKQPTVEKALYLSEFIMNCMIVTVIMANRYYYTDYFWAVPNKLTTLLSKIRNTNDAHDNEIDLIIKNLVYLTALTSLLHLSCIAFDISLWDFHFWWFIRSSGASNLPNIVISINLLQYWLALKFLTLLYKRINVILEKLSQESINAAATIPVVNPTEWNAIWFKREFGTAAVDVDATQSELIDKMRVLYTELDILLETLINAFSLILLLIFLASLLVLSIHIFSIYKFYDFPHEQNVLLLTYKITWVIQHVGRIFFILLTNNEITKEKCQTFYIINQLDSRSIILEHAINRFLLHLIVRKPIESACGIIDLDLTFLGGITSAMAMYVIFIIQTDLGNISMAERFPNTSSV